MALKFAATSVADFIIGAPASYTTDAYTTAADIAPYVAEGISIVENGLYRGEFFEDLTENDIWIGVHSFSGGFGSDTYLYLYDTGYSTTQPVFRIWSDIGSGTTGWTTNMRIDGWNGSTWVNLVTSTSGAGGSRTRFDFHIFRNDTTGSAEVFYNSVSNGAATNIDTNLVAWTAIDRVELFMDGTSGGDTWVISGLIIDTVSTLDAIFVQEVATGNGTNTAWTGDYTAIDEVGANSADAITSSTVGQIETFTGNINAIIDSGYDISSSVISANVENTGASNLRLGLTYRSGGTNYSIGNSLVAPGITVVAKKADVDPNTSAAWTPANIESAEWGVEYQAV